MSATSGSIASSHVHKKILKKANGRSRITNGSALLAGVDGRSSYARRLRDVMVLHLSDLGGEDNVSEAERSLVRRAAVLTVKLSTSSMSSQRRSPILLSSTCTKRRQTASAACSKLWGSAAEPGTSRPQTRSSTFTSRPRSWSVPGEHHRGHRRPNVFAPLLRDPGTWAAWRAFLAALFAVPMSEAELAIYRECTRRTARAALPAAQSRASSSSAAPGGESRVELIAAFLASFRDYRPSVGPGERATVMVIAADRPAGSRLHEIYPRHHACRPDVGAHDRSRTARSPRSLQSHHRSRCSRRASERHAVTRVYHSLCDELLFFGTPTKVPLTLTSRSSVPSNPRGSATIPGAIMLCASSPYARKGALWEAYRRHFGKDGDPILVWQAPGARTHKSDRGAERHR